jgi:hypothetical protein
MFIAIYLQRFQVALSSIPPPLQRARLEQRIDALVGSYGGPVMSH